MTVEKPTYDELVTALSAMMWPAYGEQLRREDGLSPSTRAGNVLSRAKGFEPTYAPRPPRGDRKEYKGGPLKGPQHKI